MASDPQRMSGGKDDAADKPLQPDPWGVKRAEKLLTSLQGVLSARVVTNAVGEVTEVHVLVQAGTAAKQMVRNVESALLAHLGLKIDHRRISVAQTALVEPIGVLEESAVQAEAKRRGVLFHRVEVRPAERSHRLKIAVTLSVGGHEVSGEYETADSGQARVQGAARAAVVALDRALPSGTLELEGAMVIEAFGLEFVFAGVHMVAERGSHLFTGTCEVKRGAEEAAVLAVLDATNRWLQSQR